MTIRIYSILIVVFLFARIANNLFAQDNVLHIPDPQKFSDDFDELIIEQSFLKLETTSDCYLPGGIPRIIFHQDLMALYYSNKSGIYLFTKSGSFVRHIHPIGSGPLECRNITSFCFFNDELYILDMASRKVVVFSILGHPLREFAIPALSYDIAVNNSGTILFYIHGQYFDDKPYNVIAFDQKSKEFFGYLPTRAINQARFNPYFVFHPSETGFIYAPPASDTILSVNGNYPEIVQILDFGRRSLSDKQKLSFDPRALHGGEPRTVLWRSFVKCEEVISFKFHTEKRSDNLLFANTTTGKVYGGKWKYPKLEFGRIFPTCGSTSNSIIFSIQALTIIEEVENNPHRCSKKLLELASSIQAEDNPVLMFWKVTSR